MTISSHLAKFVRRFLFIFILFSSLATFVLGCGGGEVTNADPFGESGLPENGFILAGEGPFAVVEAVTTTTFGFVGSSLAILFDNDGTFSANASSGVSTDPLLSLTGTYTYVEDTVFATGELVLTFDDQSNYTEGATSSAVMTVTLSLNDPEVFSGDYSGSFDETFTSANGTETQITNVAVSGTFTTR